MKTLRNLYKWLTTAEMIFCSGIFIFMVFAIVLDVIIRKLTGNSILWLEEASRVIFLYVTLIGTSLAITNDEHPKMTALYNKVSDRTHGYLVILTDIICAAFFIYMFRFTIIQTQNMMRVGMMLTTIKMKLWVVYAIFPVSFFGIISRYVVRVVTNAIKMKKGELVKVGGGE